MPKPSDDPVSTASLAKRRDPSTSLRPTEPALRVMCVDDHAVLIEGLKAQFAVDGHLSCIGHLDSAERLVDEALRLKPDVILLDIEMPGPDVFEMASRLRAAEPKVRFIFLSAHVRDGYLAAAYQAGASGYFAKGDDLEHIVAGIKEVARSTDGTFVMGPKVKDRCKPAKGAPSARKRGEAGGPVKTALESLTPRELEVLRLIGKGLSRTEIAAQLCRSAKTIDGHQERILKTLGIDSRAELMRFAIREGLAEA